MEEVENPNRKFQKELNSGAVALVLLAVLDQAKEPLYGYQIAKHLEKSGHDLPMVKQGSLYPVLRSLEKGGLLESEVEPSTSGPPRRYYRITAEGRSVLAQWASIWQRSKGFVDAVLEGEIHVSDF
jgi:PadR family transcriptional regulator PadR